MTYLALIIAIIAVIIAVMAYQKAGGAADLKKHAEALSAVGDAIVKASDNLREKTADVFDRLGDSVRGKEEVKPAARKAPKEEKKETGTKTQTGTKKEKTER
jgi:hypothetical protein